MSDESGKMEEFKKEVYAEFDKLEAEIISLSKRVQLLESASQDRARAEQLKRSLPRRAK